MTFYRRRLPHWHPENRPVFLTWSLRGSLPPGRAFPPNTVTSGQAFVAMDRLLDGARKGPLWLKRPELARVVVDSILHCADPLRKYEIHAFVVMANHVHLLVTPLITVPELTRSLKAFTARKVNELLERTGEPLWQEETYDHWVRDDREFERIRSYIEDNPVRAGLVATPEDYPWSSCMAVLANRQPGSSPALLN